MGQPFDRYSRDLSRNMKDRIESNELIALNDRFNQRESFWRPFGDTRFTGSLVTCPISQLRFAGDDRPVSSREKSREMASINRASLARRERFPK